MNEDFIKLCKEIVNQTCDSFMKIELDYDYDNYESPSTTSASHDKSKTTNRDKSITLEEVYLTKAEKIEKQLKLHKFEMKTSFFDIPKGSDSNLLLA
jgi:hypothetical protein